MSAAIRRPNPGRVFRLLSLSVGILPGAAGAQTLKHNCSFCHNLHGGSYSALSDFSVVEDLCWSCHDNAVLGDTQVLRDGFVVDVPQNGYSVHNGAKHTAFSRPPTGCWDCHNHEAESDGLQGRNLAMIQASMPTPVSGTRSVIFTSRGLDAGQASLYSFADGDEDTDGVYTGVCEACHTETSNHQNGTNLPDVSNHAHERGRTCSDCHTHDGGFAGGGPCGSCHDTGGQGTTGPNTRRAIIPELSRPSHHVGSTYQDTDCQVCHDMGAHQGGTVRLKNADDPGIVYELSGGDPNTVASEAAKITPFCLSCHDADGAGGSVPFSDGLTPPVIDAAVWASSSHEGSATIAGCYGDGAFGCHGSGHGSEKLNLLAPGDVAPNATTRYEEEEGFCFACHDADGPAVSNAWAGYNTSVLWADDVTQFGPSDQNDRHDVLHTTQAISGVKIECADCHDPHTANASNPPFSLVRLDPDPTDGRVPGTGWFADSAAVNGGTGGTDPISEWCLDCHDGSFRPGVLDNRNPQVYDILHGGQTWYSNSHGAGSSGASLKTGTNYWALDMVVSCLACHQAHPDDTPQQYTGSLFNNLFLMNDTIHGTDFTTVIPSDGASYELTSLTARKNDFVNSYYLCNTCHSSSMGSGKLNCFDCHTHGDNRF